MKTLIIKRERQVFITLPVNFSESAISLFFVDERRNLRTWHKSPALLIQTFSKDTQITKKRSFWEDIEQNCTEIYFTKII